MIFLPRGREARCHPAYLSTEGELHVGQFGELTEHWGRTALEQIQERQSRQGSAAVGEENPRMRSLLFVNALFDRCG